MKMNKHQRMEAAEELMQEVVQRMARMKVRFKIEGNGITGQWHCSPLEVDEQGRSISDEGYECRGCMSTLRKKDDLNRLVCANCGEPDYS